MKDFIRALLVVAIIIMLVIAIYAGNQVLSLNHSELTDYGWGFFTGNLVLFIISVGLIVLILIRLFRKRS
jgi:hypothetical protein